MGVATAGRLIIGRFPSTGTYLHERSSGRRVRSRVCRSSYEFLSRVEIVVNLRTIPRKSSVSTRSTQTPPFNRSLGQTPSLITSDLISVYPLTPEGSVSFASHPSMRCKSSNLDAPTIQHRLHVVQCASPSRMSNAL